MRQGIIMTITCIICCFGASGQSMHFSQYYNAPLLLNPANTALMPDNDFRVGLNYRTQWATVPVPYNTFSAFGDIKVGGNKNNEDHKNWLGLGLAFFDDKAGDGNLSLVQIQGSVAYHLRLSQTSMLSAGLSGAYIQRSVNYDNLTFDTQWDGTTFNTQLANGEKVGVIKTSYPTVGAGLNYAWFPSEFVYAKLGGSVLNINQPNESFYNKTNTVGYRPIVDLDMLFKTGPVLIVNPSIYYTTQNGAYELVFGSLFRTALSEKRSNMPAELILGVFDRWGDAVIGAAGIQVGGIQFMATYDFTMSALSPYNSAYGALEFSLIYTGRYSKNQGIGKIYNCPRFF